MWELDHKESWVLKNWYCWTVVLEKTLESSLDCKEIQPVLSILKEISPEYSLDGLMLKLKLQCFGHLMWKTDSFEKTLMLGKIEGGRRKGWQRMRRLNHITKWTWVWVNSGNWCGQGALACCGPWGCKESDMTKWLKWTDTTVRYRVRSEVWMWKSLLW